MLSKPVFKDDAYGMSFRSAKPEPVAKGSITELRVPFRGISPEIPVLDAQTHAIIEFEP